MATPGADEAGWANEKAGILARDREEQAIKSRAAASRSQACLYRDF